MGGFKQTVCASSATHSQNQDHTFSLSVFSPGMSSPTFLSVAGTLPLVTGKPSSLIFKRSKAVNTLVSYYLWLGREVSIPSGLRGTTDSTETTTALQLPSSPRLTTSLGGGLHHSGSPIHRFLLSFSTLGSRLFRTIDDNKASLFTPSIPSPKLLDSIRLGSLMYGPFGPLVIACNIYTLML